MLELIFALTLIASEPVITPNNFDMDKVDRPWSDVEPKVLGTWFESLHRDNCDAEERNDCGCCGLGDAYEADIDEWDPAAHGGLGGLVATITDGRLYCFTKHMWDELGNHATVSHCRHELPEGTKVYIPANAHVVTQQNPTHHGVVFINQSDLRTVYCYVGGFKL